MTVSDLDRRAADGLVAAGAAWAASPREVAARSDSVFTCLPSPAAVSAAVAGEHGILAGLPAGGTWIDMSTNDRHEIMRLAGRAAEKGVACLEAPVTGGVHKAASGEITVLVGGDARLFETHLPAFRAMGGQVFHMGPLGSAAVIKVITNMLAFIHLVAAGEALMLAKRGGLDLGQAFHAIKASSGNSFVHETESQLMLNGSYDIGFTMDLACKDLGFAMTSAANSACRSSSPGWSSRLRAGAAAIWRRRLVDAGGEAAGGCVGDGAAGGGVSGAAAGMIVWPSAGAAGMVKATKNPRCECARSVNDGGLGHGEDRRRSPARAEAGCQGGGLRGIHARGRIVSRAEDRLPGRQDHQPRDHQGRLGSSEHLLLRSTQDDKDGNYLWMITAKVDDAKVATDEARQAVIREAEDKVQEFFDLGSTEESIAGVKLRPFATHTSVATYLERGRRKRSG